MRSWPAVSLCVSLVLAASCSVPTDEVALGIDADELPEQLRPDFTTSTTTTLPAPPATKLANVFLVWTPPDTERRLVVEVTREIEVGASPQEVLALLFGDTAVTEEDTVAGYSNSLFELELAGVSVDGGVVTIDVIPLTPEGQPSEEAFAGDLIGAAAQLVFSATEIESIGGVRILIAGEEVSIPTSDGDAEPGNVLTRDNYEQFDPEFELPSVTTTTTVDDAGAEPGG